VLFALRRDANLTLEHDINTPTIPPCTEVQYLAVSWTGFRRVSRAESVQIKLSYNSTDSPSALLFGVIWCLLLEALRSVTAIRQVLQMLIISSWLLRISPFLIKESSARLGLDHGPCSRSDAIRDYQKLNSTSLLQLFITFTPQFFNPSASLSIQLSKFSVATTTALCLIICHYICSAYLQFFDGGWY
jgi:hypothetical protein